MSEAPERIWVDGDETGLENFLCWSWQRGSWNKSKEGVGEVEYIRADLVSEPDWQPIKMAPVGIPVLAYCYGGEVLLTRITKHGEDEYARNPDLWMPIPKLPTKDSTHD